MSGALYTGRILERDEDVAEGAAWLAGVEPKFAEVWQMTGPWPLRRRAGGFGAVLFAITGQLISTAAAAACWARLDAAGLTTSKAVARADEDALRACGLSRPKARYALGLARSDLDYGALERMEDAAVISALCAHPGIGRWTAEIYAGLALGRADVLAVGDLALQEGARMLFDLPSRPTPGGWPHWRAHGHLGAALRRGGFGPITAIENHVRAYCEQSIRKQTGRGRTGRGNGAGGIAARVWRGRR